MARVVQANLYGKPFRLLHATTAASMLSTAAATATLSLDRRSLVSRITGPANAAPVTNRPVSTTKERIQEKEMKENFPEREFRHEFFPAMTGNLHHVRIFGGSYTRTHTHCARVWKEGESNLAFLLWTLHFSLSSLAKAGWNNSIIVGNNNSSSSVAFAFFFGIAARMFPKEETLGSSGITMQERERTNDGSRERERERERERKRERERESKDGEVGI